MKRKTIRINEETYKLLLRNKLKNETFSDLIIRKISGNKTKKASDIIKLALKTNKINLTV